MNSKTAKLIRRYVNHRNAEGHNMNVGRCKDAFRAYPASKCSILRRYMTRVVNGPLNKIETELSPLEAELARQYELNSKSARRRPVRL